MRRVPLFLVLTGAVSIVRADSSGLAPRLTAAPGENATSCARCHGGTALNAGPGLVRFVLAGEPVYTPGVRQRIRVEVSDAAQRRWGLQLTARLASNPSTAQAGDLVSADGMTEVICDNGRAKPCGSAATLQFLRHTLAGTQNGTVGSASYQFDWTPPEAGAGAVTLYVAALAANGDGRTSGDRTYTANLTLQPAEGSARPAISSTRGVVNAASFQPGLSPGAWVTIAGANLAPTTRAWRAEELAEGRLPTALDGVGVTINNKPAYVQFISPAQINVLAPADSALGPVEVRVTRDGQTSDPVTAQMQAVAPALFTFDGRFLAATHADGSLVGRAGLFASAPAATTPARPGETIILYGTGFGATEPDLPIAQLAASAARVTAPVVVRIGEVSAPVAYAGLAPGFARLYQFNVQVPETLADGDHAVVAEIEGVRSPAGEECCFLTIRR